MLFTINCDFLVGFGILIIFLGGSGISYFYYSNNYPRIKMALSAILSILGVFFICIPYQELKKEYIESKIPIDNVFYYIGAEIVDQSVAGITVFETEDGNLYEIETNPNWNLDCVYLLTMDDNATPENKKDDKICVVWAESSFDY